ncbi:BRO family protein [Neptuniibacter sp.]|uniref:BRO-N domain-containing protein n=1 Tax=Neptuniibacter sp. TaxID=1962643 RepID=UPI00262D7704|nr:BRO family protein [Neptuniibacter sp.]MCP4595766.1 hypothetical protein [Neptuniibacter sp.]
MSNVIPFDFKGIQIRALEIEGEAKFVAKDIASALGYSNPRKAVIDHCKAAKPVGGNDSLPLDPQTIVIPERDMYRLIMKSQLPSAEAFEEWVVGEVLPSIRKTGGYGSGMPAINDPKLAALLELAVKQDQLEERQQILQDQNLKLAQDNQVLTERVENVELQHRNGVPAGCISKGDAYSLYGFGLSSDIFHAALKKQQVERVNYIHTTAEGFTTPTYAYRNNGSVRHAIEAFIKDAEQVTEWFCESPMLDGKRFRFKKEKAA